MSYTNKKTIEGHEGIEIKLLLAETMKAIPQEDSEETEEMTKFHLLLR